MGNKSDMNFSKFQLFLLFLVSTIIISISWIFSVLPTSTGKISDVTNRAQEQQPVNYVMAKIQSVVNLFTLEGREINRKYISLSDQSPTGAQVNPAAKSAIKPMTKVNDKTANSLYAKKTTDKPDKSGKKVIDVTKNKPVVAPKDIITKKPIPRESQEELRKKRLAEWDEYNKKMQAMADKKKKAADAKKAPEEEQQSQYVQQPPIIVNQSVPPADEKPKKSAEEWKSELMAASTQEAARTVMLKFITAFKNKEVDEIDFYMIVQGFLKSNDENQKGLGLYALRGTPSYASYLLLVKQQTEFTPTLQKYIQETLLSYHNGGLATFQQALVGKDNQVIKKTLEILKTGIMNIKSGTNDGLVDARYRRDTDHVSFNINNYLAFSRVLTDLGQNADAQIKSAAIEVNQLINAGKTTQPVVASTP